jgi:hypothetical protein
MNSSIEFHEQINTQLLQAIWHLAYSAKKVQNLTTQSDELENATLEIWESFCVRFSRVAYIFLIKHIKSAIRLEDPGFNGTFRDFLNEAQRLNLIRSTDEWFQIGELRNRIEQDYLESDLGLLFAHVRQTAPVLINLRTLLIDKNLTC